MGGGDHPDCAVDLAELVGGPAVYAHPLGDDAAPHHLFGDGLDRGGDPAGVLGLAPEPLGQGGGHLAGQGGLGRGALGLVGYLLGFGDAIPGFGPYRL